MSIKGTIQRLQLVTLWMLRTKKNQIVPLSDGASLSVDVVTPRGRGPWPVIITAFPYHKDGLGGGLAMLEGYDLIRAGYAVVTADLRGHGASDGTTRDAFDCLAGRDLHELVEWCAHQQWSNGKVGMKGESYGGMAALTAAAQNPPSLKAIYSFQAPAFFYRNLIYPGGAFNMIGGGAWLNYMNLTNLLPPLYIKGRPDWRAVWEERLEACTPYIFNITAHSTYDPYWQAIDLPVEKITIPTFIFEGWWDFAKRDGFEIYERLQGPKKLLIGPWVHTFPTFSPIERMDYVHDMIRWFDYWLKGEDMGIVNEPPFSIYVPGANCWQYEQEWPPQRAVARVYHLQGDGTMACAADRQPKLITYAHDPGVGTAAGYELVFPLGIDYPVDQCEDDARSLTFATAPLAEAVQIAGWPEVTLTLATDMRDAAITAKLTDVSPDGASNLITSGTLRLICRESTTNPQLPVRGTRYEMTLKLSPCHYQLAVGHRLQLAISLSDFPRLFPLPYKGGIELLFGDGLIQRLKLLTMLGAVEQERRPHFSQPDLSAFGSGDRIPPELMVQRDEESGKTSVRGSGHYRIPGLHLKRPLEIQMSFEARLEEGKPDTAVLESTGSAQFLLDGQSTHCATHQTFTQRDAEVTVKIVQEGATLFEKAFAGPISGME
jgi:hypothetical protein